MSHTVTNLGRMPPMTKLKCAPFLIILISGMGSIVAKHKP